MEDTLARLRSAALVEAPAGHRGTFLLAALAAAATGLSSYLLWATLARGGVVPGCGGSELIDCQDLLTGRWATWLGVPVSAAGVAVYGSVLAAVAWLLATQDAFAPLTRLGWTITLTGGVLAAAAGLWFVGLQYAVLDRYCPFCLGVHACGLALCGIAFWCAPIAWRAGEGELLVGTGLGPDLVALAVTLGGLGAAGLAAGQVYLPPRLYEVTTLPDAERAESESATQRPPASAPASQAGSEKSGSAEPGSAEAGPEKPRERVLYVLGRKHGVNLGEQPLLGSPDAAHVALMLFDYTCPHCHQLQQQLEQLRPAYGSRLAVALLVSPMHVSCNRFVGPTHPRHAQACEYARLALAVWRIDRQVFAQFHGTLMAGESPPALPQARALAASLVGERRLAAAEADPWIEAQIAKNTSLYEKAGRGRIPKLVLGDQAVSGEFVSAAQLQGVLDVELGITP